MIDLKLNGKIALVTGVNNPSGIGAAIARAFAKQGVSLYMTYFRKYLDQKDELESHAGEGSAENYRYQQTLDAKALVLELESFGVAAIAKEYDFRQAGVAQRVFTDALDAFPDGVDILVNNAASVERDTFDPKSIEESESGLGCSLVEPATIEPHLAVSIQAPVLLMKEYVLQHRALRKTSGSIINLSTDGAQCFPGEISYGASKYALESVSYSAAKELGKYGITVNIVSPGPVQNGWMSDKLQNELAQSIPLGRVGTPEDIADAVLFFASQQSRWISGQLLHVGGGH